MKFDIKCKVGDIIKTRTGFISVDDTDPRSFEILLVQDLYYEATKFFYKVLFLKNQDFSLIGKSFTYYAPYADQNLVKVLANVNF